MRPLSSPRCAARHRLRLRVARDPRLPPLRRCTRARRRARTLNGLNLRPPKANSLVAAAPARPHGSSASHRRQPHRANLAVKADTAAGFASFHPGCAKSMGLSGICMDFPCMTACSPDQRLAGEVFEDSPTVRLYVDDGLVDDWDHIAPQPRSEALVLRVENVRRRTRLQPVFLVLMTVSLALAVAFVLKSKSSRTHSTNSAVPRASVSRPLSRRARAAGHRGPQHGAARRAVRGSARHSRVARGAKVAPRRALRPAVSVAPSSAGYASPRPSVSAPPRHGDEFGFERRPGR